MAYLTADEFLARIPDEETTRLTDEAGQGVVDTMRLDTALQDASDEVDGYVAAGGYALPLSPVPPILIRIVIDLAREALHTLYPSDAVSARAERARAMLKDIATGKLLLPTPEGPTPTTTGDEAVYQAAPGMFSDCALTSYRGLLG